MSWYAFGLFRYSIFLRFFAYHYIAVYMSEYSCYLNLTTTLDNWSDFGIPGGKSYPQNVPPKQVSINHPMPLCRPYPDHCRSLGRPRFFGGNVRCGINTTVLWDVPSPTKSGQSRWASELHHLMVQTWRVDSSSPRFKINTASLTLQIRPLAATSYFWLRFKPISNNLTTSYTKININHQHITKPRYRISIPKAMEEPTSIAVSPIFHPDVFSERWMLSCVFSPKKTTNQGNYIYVKNILLWASLPPKKKPSRCSINFDNSVNFNDVSLPWNLRSTLTWASPNSTVRDVKAREAMIGKAGAAGAS